MSHLVCSILCSNDYGKIFGRRGAFDNSACESSSSRWFGLKLVAVLWILTEVCAFPQAKNVTIVTVTESKTAILNCSQSSEPVNWRSNATATQTFSSSNVQKFERVMRNDSGFYSCNGTNSTIYYFQLIVNYAAEVIRFSTTPSETLNLSVGTKVTLKCEVRGLPSDINMVWYKEHQLKQASIENSTDSFTIEDAKCEDGGRYVCAPRNAVGNAKNGTFEVSFVDVPDVPVGLDFDQSRTTATSLTVTWNQNQPACVYIKHFDLKYCEFSTSAEGCVPVVEEVLSASTTNSYTLTDLKPFTNYAVWVKATTHSGNKSNWSANAWGSTSKAAPSRPRNVTVPKESKVPVIISWSQPEHLNGPQNELEYLVFYKSEHDINWQNESTDTNSHTLKNLAALKYRLKVQARNHAGSSNESETVTFSVTLNDGESGLSSGEKVGIVIGAIFAVIVIVFAAILLRRKVNCKLPLRGFFSLRDSVSLSPLQRIHSIRYEERREPIRVESFPGHVTWLHADSDYKFSLEFEAINGVHEKSKKISWDHSQKSENQSKNRYANVVAYDHSRVVLSLNDGDPNSHYINANYVDGYKTMNAYIAAQGPLANTRADFWRMIWEQNCRVVVMITNIIEKGRHKCAMYWPSKKTKTEAHGPLQVTFLDEECFASYTVRTLEVKPLEGQSHYSQDPSDEEMKPMIVKQYHYTSWPDHGAPDYCFPVLDFVVKSTAANRNNSGPIVVHCSAGVGRSGAYIVIDSMMRRMQDSTDLDVFNFLVHIRHQRNHLVQEECQYIFVHDALAEYIKCEFNLSVKKADLKQHLNELRTKRPDASRTGMEIEFQRLRNIKVEHYKCKEAGRACNVSKNRNQKCIPVDLTRVKLYPRPGEEGSDYISASYVDSFRRREAYIATQHPLQSTTDDFWRMIWQENSRSIVMLLSQTEWEQGGFHRYLPPIYDSKRFGSYEVTVEAESTRGDVITREIKMIKIEDPSEFRQIRHFHYLHWERDELPWSGQTVLQLINKTEEWETEVKEKAKKFEMIGPVVVHCSTGTGRTGVYCALHTIWQQLQRENTVSVYQTVHLAMQQRPHCVETQKQYEFIYDTILEFIEADCSLYLV